jgi:hypothetical protein
MKTLAVKQEEKRLRKWFDDNVKFPIINGIEYIKCDIPNSTLSDNHVKQVFDLHLLRRYKRKFKWV